MRLPPVQNSVVYTPGSPNIGCRTVTVEMLTVLPGDEPRARRLKLQGDRREHELPLRVGEAQLHLMRLANVGRAESKARHHRKRGPAWQLRH
jgi:hypothetical protein